MIVNKKLAEALLALGLIFGSLYLSQNDGVPWPWIIVPYVFGILAAVDLIFDD